MPMTKYFSCLHCDIKVDRNCFGQDICLPCFGPLRLPLNDLITVETEHAVPELMIKCLEQIEERGINTENLYQESNEKEASKLFTKYLDTKSVAQLKLHKLDISTLTALVMHTLRSLKEPLIGAKMWQDLARACGE